MSVPKIEDISQIRFSSTVFPTTGDKALWERLTPEQQLAVLRRDEQAGFDSGVADHASMAEIITEARSIPAPPQRRGKDGDL